VAVRSAAQESTRAKRACRCRAVAICRPHFAALRGEGSRWHDEVSSLPLPPFLQAVRARQCVGVRRRALAPLPVTGARTVSSAVHFRRRCVALEARCATARLQAASARRRERSSSKTMRVVQRQRGSEGEARFGNTPVLEGNQANICSGRRALRLPACGDANQAYKPSFTENARRKEAAQRSS